MSPSPTNRDWHRLFAVVLGAILAGGGLMHMFLHAQPGVHDMAAVLFMVVGTGIAFNREVVALIRAWRGK